jgi:cobalt-zinc-cadmium efflux system protein
LLEGVPPSLNLAEVKTELEAALPEVREVHHIHAWSITGEQHLLTLHVVPNETASSRAVITAVKDRLRERFSIEHVTVQVEEGGCIDHTRDAAATTAKPPACR